MTPKRRFSPNGYVHIFHITADKGICFYSAADCLVWFTLFCVLAVKYRVRVIAVCIMLNHFHFEAMFPTKEVMAEMMRELGWIYTRAYNRNYGRSGALFSGKYGSAVKMKAQKVKENFLYIGNNPVIKKAVRKAPDYRWNFLRYMLDDHPFSERIVDCRCSRRMKFLMAEIRRCRDNLSPIGYRFFQGSYKMLETRERLQLIDYIIVKFNVIDYDYVSWMWGGYEGMCAALSLAWGAEYDLEDDVALEDYRHHYKMIRIASESGIDLARGCPEKLRLRLAWKFRDQVGASNLEIAKLMHLSEVVVSSYFHRF